MGAARSGSSRRMTRVLDGVPAARSLLDSAEWAVAEGVRKGRPPPRLVSVHRGSSSPFSVYLRQQAKTAARIGASFEEIPLPHGPAGVDLVSLLGRLDADERTHGVLLEHPLPKPWPFAEAIDRLRPEKDIDGVSSRSLGLLAARRPVHLPAVVRGALRLAEHHHVRLAGRRVAVIGRSETVGMPMAAVLGQPGPHGDATVTIVHSKTPDLGAAIHDCEVVFSCAGKAGLLTRSNTPRDAIVIDVGLSTVPDPANPARPRVVGDADLADLEGWADAISPVPGGVGPVTVAALFANLVAAWDRLGAASRRSPAP